MCIRDRFLGRDAFVAHTFLFLGSTCFDILVWLLIYSVGRRSVAAVLPVFAATFALQMFGRFAGANLGRVAFSTVAQDPRGTQTVILLLAIFFFVFIWTAFKGFSFTAAIQGAVSYTHLCNQCHHVFHIDVFDEKTWVCPYCKAEKDYRLNSGMEFSINRIEIVGSGASAAGTPAHDGQGQETPVPNEA